MEKENPNKKYCTCSWMEHPVKYDPECKIHGTKPSASAVFCEHLDNIGGCNKRVGHLKCTCVLKQPPVNSAPCVNDLCEYHHYEDKDAGNCSIHVLSEVKKCINYKACPVWSANKLKAKIADIVDKHTNEFGELKCGREVHLLNDIQQLSAV